ncbi:Protein DETOXIFICATION 48 [Linum perenne]
MISMLFLGYLGELELAGGSLSIGFANITGYSVISGLAMGMEPICGQAYGAKQMKLLGLTLQRTVLLLLTASIPISIIWLNRVSTRVGNELGANRPGRARVSTIVSMICSLVLGVAAMSFAMMMRWRWGRLFTTDADILELTSLALPIVGLCELGNCPQTTGCGVLRGSARPTVGANINLGSFYLVGMPVAVGLGFGSGMGFVGLWFGLLAAQASCALLMLVVLWRTDWMVEIERSRDLTKSSDIVPVLLPVSSGNKKMKEEEGESTSKKNIRDNHTILETEPLINSQGGEAKIGNDNTVC